MTTIKFIGIKEHINATIKTTAILSMLSIYPKRALMSSNAIKANTNFKSGVMYTSYLLYRVIKICFITSKVVIIYTFTSRTLSQRVFEENLAIELARFFIVYTYPTIFADSSDTP